MPQLTVVYTAYLYYENIMVVYIKIVNLSV